MTVDRALHFARNLLARMRQLEEALLDDAAPDLSEEAMRRQEVVQKVLLSETGIVDHATTTLVLGAMPRVIPGEETSERELAEFARFLSDHVLSTV